MPKRSDPDDFFAQLNERQSPHLAELRRISLDYAPTVVEELKWNQPAYTRNGKQQWILQAFAKHCSLRFSPAFFAQFQDEVHAQGYDCGAGFLKILYTQQVPETLCRRLIEAKLAEADA